MNTATQSMPKPAPSERLRRPSVAPARPPVPVPAPRIAITGTLAEDAYSATEPATGRAAFTVVVAQPGGAPSIAATRWVGDGPDAASFASRRAGELRAGDVVTVHGDSLRLRYRNDLLTLVVGMVRDIELEVSTHPERTT